MYLVTCDGTPIYNLNRPDLVLIDPKLELELNSPGSFECALPPTHPYYDLPQKMTSRIQVYQDDEEIFCGRIIEETVDFYKQKHLYCEGELAFLNDSVQRPAEYHDITPHDYFSTLIEEHNKQVEEDKQFEIGIVTVSDTNDSLFRYTNYNSTMTEMKEDLVDDLGGYIRVRNQNGHRYLDYVTLEDYGVMNEQTIRFGANLMDYSQDMDVTDIATVIIPLGAKLEESPIAALEMRLTIEDVNDGSDALESEDAVKTFGRLVKTVIWDDVTVASNLKSKGEKYLSDYQFDNMTLEVSAVDLHYTDEEIERFHLGDQIRVISTPHGLDRWFPLSKMSISLDAPENNTFTLGTNVTNTTLSSRVVSTDSSIHEVEESITPTQKILNGAKEQATNLITAATHGYVVMQPNEEPEEILVMNTPDISTATKLWRWNLGGLGYSSTGYNGTYGTAITMDGAIVADYITTGTLTANVIKAGTIQDVKGNNSWNLDTGVLNCTNGTFSGTLSAATGTFAGSLSAVTGTFTSIYTGSHSSYSSTANGFYAGTDGLSLGSNFRVSNTGEMTCTSGTFSGSLSAVTGTFTSIYTGSHSSYSSTNNGFYAGTDGLSLGQYFRVSNTGAMTCTSGTFSGSLSAATGTFAGSLSAASGTFNGTVTVTSGNYVETLGSGALTILYSSTEMGMVRSSYWTSNSSKRGFTINLTNAAYSGFAIDGTLGFIYNNSLNPDGYTETILIDDTSRFTYPTYHSSSVYIDTVRLWESTGDDLYVYSGIYADGNIKCTGTKSRAVNTEDYGEVLLYAYETASPTFGDSGSGTVGEDGQVSIFFQPEFAETVDVGTDYQVFLTRTSEKEAAWVQKEKGYFTVYGDPGAEFDWMVSVHQRDYSMTRLEAGNTDPANEEIEFDDSIFRGDNAAETKVNDMIDEYEQEVDLL